MFGRFFMFQAWLSLVDQNLDAVRTGVTPITKLLLERNTSLTSHAARRQPEQNQLLDVNTEQKAGPGKFSRLLIAVCCGSDFCHVFIIQRAARDKALFPLRFTAHPYDHNADQ